MNLTSQPYKTNSARHTHGLPPPNSTRNYSNMDVAGLVSSIITFLDFSWTIVRGTYDIHSSGTSATEENVHIGNVLQDLRAVTEKMRTDIPGQGDHERALLELEHQCRGLSSDLAAILQKLSVKRRSGLQSLNIMLRSLMKEKDVRGIEKRLGEYRVQMILRVNLMLLERSVAIQNSLPPSQHIEPTRLRDLKKKAEALNSDNSILHRLYFDDMYNRADSITTATYGTFDWLLAKRDDASEKNASEQTSDNKSTAGLLFEDRERRERRENAAKLSEFLEHGDGVFFLRGKPGSGKSTLMKYLIEGRGKQEVDQKLRKWAGQKRLIRVSVMFLLHGTSLQRSLEGFYRTLFFELLCQFPEFADILFSEYLNPELSDESYTPSFRLETLQAAWQRLLLVEDLDKIRICLSIDGMDEMEGNSGDRLRFARVLKGWAKSEDIKIICSGRPNQEFNLVFDQPHRVIDLQNLTRADIRNILEQRFEEVRHLGDLTREDTEELISEISNQSDGVILWAVLVGRSLEDDIMHGQSLNTMKRTIEALPSAIEELFNEMLHELPNNSQQQLILRIINGLLECSHQFSHALPLSWLDEALCDSEFPYNRPIKTLKAVELNYRLEKVRGQLIQYTRHFVEVGNTNPNNDDRYLHADYRFIHRSAREFIQSKLKLVGSEPSELDAFALDLGLRLCLMFEMSVKREHPTEGVSRFFKIQSRHVETGQAYQQKEFHQLRPRFIEKLCELLELRRGLLLGDRTDFESGFSEWKQLQLRDNRLLVKTGRLIHKRDVSTFHLALGGHQVNYITRVLQDSSQEVEQEDLSLGLLICAAGRYPNYQLFNLLVDHGSDPNCLVNVYTLHDRTTPKLVPLWLLFCFKLAFLVFASSRWGLDHYSPGDGLNKFLPHEFLILERLLHLGYGQNVRFLLAPRISQRPPLVDVAGIDERNLVGLDLAQIVRHAKPDNMKGLLLLLESPRITMFSMAQQLADFVFQSQFPFRTLPSGATTMPYRRVSNEYLIGQSWDVWAAFEGEHEIINGLRYYLPR